MKYKTKKVDGIDVSYSSDWINDLENEIHFNWYYQQARLVYEHCARSDSLLEIGVGSSLLSDLLKRRNWKITTLDIDADKNPDICESASEFDFSSVNTDVVLAFEVFEHMPFTTFEKVVDRFSKSKVKSVYFSLPWNEFKLMEFKLWLPFVHDINFRLDLPVSRNRIDTLTHFWELANREKYLNEKRLVKIQSVVELFGKHGFDLIRLKKIGYIQYFQALRSH